MPIGARLIIASALMSAIFVAQPSLANSLCPTLKIAAAEIPHFVESEEEGEFVELIRAAADRAALDIKIMIYPKKRALNLFSSKQVDALLPHSSAGEDVPSYKSVPILTKRDYVFVLQGTSVPTSIQDLEGLRIGLTSQYAYPKQLTSNDKIIVSRAPNSDLENLKMLSIGRFDGAVVEERSGQKAIADAGISNVIYDKEYPINELQVWMLFQLNECGRFFMQEINTQLHEMEADGTWNSIQGLSDPNG